MRALDFSMSVAAVTHMLMATVLLLALAFAPTHTSQAVQGLNVTTVHAYAPGGAPGGQLGASVAAAGSWGEPRSAVLVRAAAIGQLVRRRARRPRALLPPRGCVWCSLLTMGRGFSRCPPQ